MGCVSVPLVTRVHNDCGQQRLVTSRSGCFGMDDGHDARAAQQRGHKLGTGVCLPNAYATACYWHVIVRLLLACDCSAAAGSAQLAASLATVLRVKLVIPQGKDPRMDIHH